MLRPPELCTDSTTGCPHIPVHQTLPAKSSSSIRQCQETCAAAGAVWGGVSIFATLISPEEGPCCRPRAIKGETSSTSAPKPRAATASMKLFSLLLFLLGLALASCNLLQFGAMITQVTGKLPGAYNGYGCYCGWGGTKQPLDATDRCCHAHDCCYKRLVAAGCRPKSDIYKYTFRGNRVTCGSGTSCERRICACDKAAVECFKRTAGSYRKSYANYPQSKCKGRAPSC